MNQVIENFTGEIFWQGEEGYEPARFNRVFNLRRPNRHPAAIACPLDPEDVVSIVKFAADENLKIAIRAGGHSWPVWSVRDKTVLIDLKYFNKIDLDIKSKIVAVQPAVKGGEELNPYLSNYDLMFCGGHCPTVGVGGFLLQGGQGWNARGWGWAAEYIVAIDVVTANGELLKADANQNSDLYWAARGAGPGFFGVVTCFYLQTIALPKALTQSTYVYPVALREEVLKWLQQIHGTVATTVEIVAVGQQLKIENIDVSVLIVHALAFAESYEDADTALKPFETCPVVENALVRIVARATTFAEECATQINQNPEGHRYAVSNAWLVGDADKVVSKIGNAFANLPTAKTFTLWFSMAPLRELPDMAFSLQTEIYFAIYSVWENEEEDEKCQLWLQEQMERIEPVTAGQYLGDSDFTTHHRKFISDDNWKRLKAIQKVRDPKGLFAGHLTTDAEKLNSNVFL